MAIDRSIIGSPYGEHVVTIDRAVVSNFAHAVGEASAIHQDLRAAHAAGFHDVPVTPTFPFVMIHWGTRRELSDEFQIEPVPPNPFSGVADQLGHLGPLIAEMTQSLGPGLVLHAEQEFSYHRTPIVGETLRGKNTIVDVYEKSSGDAVLTFVVIETAWTEATQGAPVVTTRFTAVHRP